MNLHSSLTTAWDWSKKWYLPINPTKCNCLTIGREAPLRLSFFPNGSGTTIPVSKFVKDLSVQTDNMFSPSDQCTEATNKARRFIFMIRRSFQDLSKSAFIPLYGALVRPHLEHGMSACHLFADFMSFIVSIYLILRHLNGRLQLNMPVVDNQPFCHGSLGICKLGI